MRRRNRTASFLILLSCRYALDSKLRSNLREREREKENNFRDTVGGGPVLLRARALGNELSTRPFAVLRCRKTRLCLCTHTHYTRRDLQELNSRECRVAEFRDFIWSRVIPTRLINFMFTHLPVYMSVLIYLLIPMPLFIFTIDVTYVSFSFFTFVIPRIIDNVIVPLLFALTISILLFQLLITFSFFSRE